MSQDRQTPMSPDDPPVASPTLADVARAAGVSTATVSRCLNAPDRVVETTRQRVMSAVRDLGYAPNFGARVLAARRTNTIGAIIPTMENAIFARGIQAFQEELARHGMTLLVASAFYRPDLEEEQIRTLLARGADALLLIGYDRPAVVQEFLARRRIPCVITWTAREDSPHLSVGFDNITAMQRLAERVLALGHRRLAVISAPRTTNDRARDRVAGVLHAVREAGLPEASVEIVETPYAIENGKAAMRRLMERPEPPTAVMCGNDVLAAGALAMARSLGLAVPADVSVTGFDDIELAQIVEPPLTTVQVPHRAMGEQAARRIVELLRGDAVSGNTTLPVRIVERGSLGPAPS